VMHQPLSDHLSHNLWILGDGIPVSVVEQLAVLESRLLGTRDSFEPVISAWMISLCNI
jgi:hypothetical protein